MNSKPLAVLLAFTVFISGLAGGVIGSVLTANNAASAATQPAGVVTAQPIAQVQVPESSASAIYQQAGASVVEINVTNGGGRFASTGNGSGVIVDEAGYILTNAHVVAGGGAITVLFADGSTADAELLGTDSGNDLALLQAELPESAVVAPLGDSDQVVVGETVVAIGSPFGLEQSVTQGIVSAVDRDWWPSGGRAQRNLIQTDTPINPGNSGGPLLNTRGEVIGINSMIESPVSGSVGVGFAIPINTAKSLLPDLEAGAQLEPVWLGISGQNAALAVAAGENLSTEEGVLIMDVAESSPAERAGLRAGDIIAAIDNKAVPDMEALVETLAAYQPGDSVTLTVTRDGDTIDLTATLAPWPQQ